MNKELLAALSRIEAIAHYYSRIAGQSDEITDAFKGIVDEVGEAIALAKRSTTPDLLAALEGMVEMATHHMMEPKERREILRNARAAIAKAKGEQ
jgi:hypothetical protein